MATLPQKTFSVCNMEDSAHCLGDFNQDKTIWKPVGVIDFGDVKRGDRLYDLISAHVDLFKCDKSLTLRMMASYGLDDWKRKVNCFFA